MQGSKKNDSPLSSWRHRISAFDFGGSYQFESWRTLENDCKKIHYGDDGHGSNLQLHSSSYNEILVYEIPSF